MKYSIIRTDKANDQLYDIINYIAEDSGDIDIAIGYLDKIEKAIMGLGEFPYKGSRPRYSTLKKQGYLVLIMEKHIIFYKVDEVESLVIIYAVVDSRREYENLL